MHATKERAMVEKRPSRVLRPMNYFASVVMTTASSTAAVGPGGHEGALEDPALCRSILTYTVSAHFVKPNRLIKAIPWSGQSWVQGFSGSGRAAELRWRCFRGSETKLKVHHVSSDLIAVVTRALSTHRRYLRGPVGFQGHVSTSGKRRRWPAPGGSTNIGCIHLLALCSRPNISTMLITT
jgi:hypothetical protein